LYYFKKDGRLVGLSFGLLIVGNQSAGSPLRSSGLYTTANLQVWLC